MAIGRSLCQTRLSAERPRLGRYAPAHRRTRRQRRQAGGAFDGGGAAGKPDHADVGRLPALGAAGPRRSLADRTAQVLLQPDTSRGVAIVFHAAVRRSRSCLQFTLGRSNFPTKLFSWYKQWLR